MKRHAVKRGRTASYKNLCIRGKVYADATAAARALGISSQTVLRARRLGILDRCGLGHRGPVPMPVEIYGVSYASSRDAAEVLGVSVSTISQMLTDGRAFADGPPARTMRGGHNGKPVHIGPMDFRSYAEAARALGFSRNYISSAMRGGSDSQRQRLLGAAMRVARGRG